jgi:hypothetical protein
VLTPGPKKNEAVTDVLRILQQQHEPSGWSYRRLIRRYGLPRSSVLRWQSNIRHGHPAIRRPGPAKRALKDAVILDQNIAELRHGVHRSKGAPALWQSWREHISRADYYQRLAEHRLNLRREERQRLQRSYWNGPGAVWAMDGAEYVGCRYNLVGDLASRYRFDLLIAPDLPAIRIVQQLAKLFDQYGAPLVLKRDNGSNLVNAEVDQLLDAHGVIALTSPAYWPRYNGAIEYAQREIKIVAGILSTLDGMPVEEALLLAPQVANEKPRPCLHGGTANEVFHADRQTLSQRYTLKHRKEIKHWINDKTGSILDTMTARNRHTQAAVRRLVIETWMRDEGIFVPVRNPNVSPLFL